MGQQEIGRAYKGRLLLKRKRRHRPSQNEAVIEQLRSKFDEAVIVSQAEPEQLQLGEDIVDDCIFAEEYFDNIRVLLIEWFKQTPNESHAMLLKMLSRIFRRSSSRSVDTR